MSLQISSPTHLFSIIRCTPASWIIGSEHARGSIIIIIMSMLTMARRRTRLVLFLLFLVVFPPFLRSTGTALIREPPSLPPEYTESSQKTSHMLLSPTFLIHLGWIIGLTLLSIVAILDVLMKLVFWGCSMAVYFITPETLPLRPISRYIIIINFYKDVHNLHM